MRKGLILLFGIVLASFSISLSACRPAPTTPDVSGKSGFPKGHDMHPDTDLSKDPTAHPLSGYS